MSAIEKTATLNLRVNPSVKQRAEDVLKRLGIPMATAIDMYLNQITLTGGIPFAVALPKAPMSVNTDLMSTDEIHAKLQEGCNEMKTGKVQAAAEAFAKFRENHQNRRVTVLCYGDSNTYGYNPMNGMRYPEDVRWTGRLQKLLGEEYRVIEEGCNGRTTVYDDPVEGWKNGLGYLSPCLNTHKPVDFVILMLGTNDLKEVFHASAEEIADGAGLLVHVIQEFTEAKQGFVPKIILVSPPEIGEGIRSSNFYGSFYENAVDRSREFPKWYRKTAEKYGCIFFDAARYISPSAEDSLHLSPEAHRELAEQLYKVLRDNR